MPRVLVIDDDTGVLDTFPLLLQHAGYDVLAASTGCQGLELARRRVADVILADLVLPDISGLDVLRQLAAERIDTPVVIMTGHASISSAVEATKLGAVDYVLKPLIDEDVVRAVQRGLAARAHADTDGRSEHPRAPELHAAARWAKVVVSALDAEADPRRLEDWGKLANAAPTTLRNRCRAADQSAKASLDFTRLLRAVVNAQRMGCEPQVFLDVGDPRTLHRLLACGGLASGTHAPGPLEFLQRQRLITDPVALTAIKQALASGGFV